MREDAFYKTALRRFILKTFQRAGIARLSYLYLTSPWSRFIIPGYIRIHGIDMTPFKGQKYKNFAEFHARKRNFADFVEDPDVLISPCDSFLSVYSISDDFSIPMKGSTYTLSDLIPDSEAFEVYKDGLCLVFRLESADYHRFCSFDDCYISETNLIPGQLHSVQPITLNKVPVFSLNRRWWNILDTEHFGTVVQIEVGAMLVGGVSMTVENGSLKRGQDMGTFELAGSTIVLIMESSVRKRLDFEEYILPAFDGKKEVRVQIGSALGTLRSTQE